VRKLKWLLTLLSIFVMARMATFLAGVPTPPPPSDDARRARRAVLSRAQVFVDRLPDIASLDFTRHPDDEAPFSAGKPVACRFVPEPVSGTTPKFTCRLETGELVKVKYGRTPEIPAEVGATRLLAAIGFATDRVSLVEALRCDGCPPTPFRARQLADALLLSALFERSVDYDRARVFRRVTIERKHPATPIEAESLEGWDFTELDAVKESAGGASRADLDALRLAAVLLAHWDNKAANQRLVCLDPVAEASSTSCVRPLLMLQDLGATFGPRKTNLEGWAEAPVWEDEAACTAGMTTLPYSGATFRPVRISEAGRLRLAGRLRQLSRDQMRRLFATSGFPTDDGGVDGWVNTLEAKIRDVIERPPCPPAQEPLTDH
jgi:hypothetical protein